MSLEILGISQVKLIWHDFYDYLNKMHQKAIAFFLNMVHEEVICELMMNFITVLSCALTVAPSFIYAYYGLQQVFQTLKATQVIHI